MIIRAITAPKYYRFIYLSFSAADAPAFYIPSSFAFFAFIVLPFFHAGCAYFCQPN